MGVTVIQVWDDTDSGLGSLIEATLVKSPPTERSLPELLRPEVTPQLQVIVPTRKKKRA